MGQNDGIKVLKNIFLFYQCAFEELINVQLNSKVHIEDDKIIIDSFNSGFYRYIFGYNRNDVYKFLNIHLTGYMKYLRQLDLSQNLEEGINIEMIRSLKHENQKFINKIHSGLFNFTLIYKDDKRFEKIITEFDITYTDYLKL